MASALQRRIGLQVRALRHAAGLSLEALAQRSGVSRSMLSLIERGESSPTAVLLEKVAHALGQTLAALFNTPPEGGASGAGPERMPLLRREAQTHWTDPGSGYRRRNLSPPGHDGRLQLVEVHFPPGASVAFDSAERRPAVHQQVWLMSGELQVRIGARQHALAAGDCLAMALDAPTAFHNPGAVTAHYLVALALTPDDGAVHLLESAADARWVDRSPDEGEGGRHG